MNLVQILFEAKDAASQQVRDLRRELQGMQQDVEESAASTSQAGAQMAAGMSGMAVAAAAAAAAAAVSIAVLAAVATEAIKATDALADLTREFDNLEQSSGVSMDNLRGISLEFERLGLPVSSLRIGLSRLQDAISDEDPVLAALGVTAKDTWGALIQLSDAFPSLVDGPNKSAHAARLFGQSAKDWIPVLNEGSDALKAAGANAEAMGLGLERTRTAALNAGSEMAEFRQRVAGLGQDLTEMVLPAVTDFVDLMNRLLTSLRGIPEAMRAVGVQLRGFVNAMPLGKQLLDLLAFVAALERMARIFNTLKGKDSGGFPPKDTRTDPGPPPPEKPTKTPKGRKGKEAEEFGPGSPEGIAAWARFMMAEADRALRDMERSLAQTQRTLAQGFTQVFDGIVSGALGFKGAMIGIFKTLVKAITDELAKLLASQAMKLLLSLGGKLLFGAATGGAGLIPAGTLGMFSTTPGVGGGGAAVMGGGPVTNVYINATDAKSLNDQFRSSGGAFNVVDYRRQQAGAI